MKAKGNTRLLSEELDRETRHLPEVVSTGYPSKSEKGMTNLGSVALQPASSAVSFV